MKNNNWSEWYGDDDVAYTQYWDAKSYIQGRKSSPYVSSVAQKMPVKMVAVDKHTLDGSICADIIIANDVLALWGPLATKENEIQGWGVVKTSGDGSLPLLYYGNTVVEGEPTHVSYTSEDASKGMMMALQECGEVVNCHIHSHPGFSSFSSGTDDKNVRDLCAAIPNNIFDMWFVIIDGIDVHVERHVGQADGSVRYNTGVAYSEYGVKLKSKKAAYSYSGKGNYATTSAPKKNVAPKKSSSILGTNVKYLPEPSGSSSLSVEKYRNDDHPFTSMFETYASLIISMDDEARSAGKPSEDDIKSLKEMIDLISKDMSGICNYLLFCCVHEMNKNLGNLVRETIVGEKPQVTIRKGEERSTLFSVFEMGKDNKSLAKVSSDIHNLTFVDCENLDDCAAGEGLSWLFNDMFPVNGGNGLVIPYLVMDIIEFTDVSFMMEGSKK